MLGSLAVLAGLLINIGLNLVLLPSYGLAGAVASAAIANLIALGVTYVFSVHCGLKFDCGAWIVLLLPPLLCFGPWIALSGLALVALWAAKGTQILSPAEKDQVLLAGADYIRRLRARLQPLLSGPLS